MELVKATEASIKANQAKPNAGDSPTISSNYDFLSSTSPVLNFTTPTLNTVVDNSLYDSFFSDYLNKFIYDAGQVTEASFMTNQTYSNAADKAPDCT